MTAAERPAPRLNLRFLYRYCNDIPSMRAFYSDAVGLQEYAHHDDENFGWLAYRSEGLEFMVFRAPGPVSVAEGFAGQPGDGGGDSPRSSVSIEVPETDFRGLVERLRARGDPAMTPAPTWRQDSYWGWTVNDPMGETIEFFFAPAERPDGDPPVWS